VAPVLSRRRPSDRKLKHTARLPTKKLEKTLGLTCNGFHQLFFAGLQVAHHHDPTDRDVLQRNVLTVVVESHHFELLSHDSRRIVQNLEVGFRLLLLLFLFVLLVGGFLLVGFLLVIFRLLLFGGGLLLFFVLVHFHLLVAVLAVVVSSTLSRGYAQHCRGDLLAFFAFLLFQGGGVGVQAGLGAGFQVQLGHLRIHDLHLPIHHYNGRNSP
jgi:hypothetical protein